MQLFERVFFAFRIELQYRVCSVGPYDLTVLQQFVNCLSDQDDCAYTATLIMDHHCIVWSDLLCHIQGTGLGTS
jgi:hypothetical protein